MLSRLRNLPADAWHGLVTHRIAALVVVIALAAGGAAGYLLAPDDEPDELAGVRPAPNVLIGEVPEPERTEDLGFPGFATKNTTRVAGVDATANAAAVALAVHPSAGGVPGPDAVTLVGADDWTAAVVAGALVADPIGAPVLAGSADEVPEITENTIAELDPKGSGATAGRQLFALGDVEVPRGVDAIELDSEEPADLAAEVAQLRRRLAGAPEHILLVSSQEAEFSVPAAAWAARSGDPVLFVERDDVPEATREVLQDNKETPVYVLGPEDVISERALRAVREIVPNAQRVGADDPVTNAIEFARHASGSFGWDINDPGHGFVIAPAIRPVDAAIASPLSASGTWGPLLLSDDSETLPDALRGYLLDLKPGYESDPTRALYNHIWLIGDTAALSVGLQAEADELAEVAAVSSGTGADAAVPPGTPESQPDDEPDGDDAADEEPSDQPPADGDDTDPDQDQR